jgi:cyclohexyl-isocyanide hydratase
MHGRDVAETIQLGIEYDPAPLGGGTPDKARPEVLARYRRAAGGIIAAREAEFLAMLEPQESA